MSSYEKQRLAIICAAIIITTIILSINTNIPFQVTLCDMSILLIGSELFKKSVIEYKIKWLILILLSLVSVLTICITVAKADVIIYTCICIALVIIYGALKTILKK